MSSASSSGLHSVPGLYSNQSLLRKKIGNKKSLLSRLLYLYFMSLDNRGLFLRDLYG
jgi:hypothetical protein